MRVQMANVASVCKVIAGAVWLGKNSTNNIKFCHKKCTNEGFTIKVVKKTKTLNFKSSNLQSILKWVPGVSIF